MNAETSGEGRFARAGGFNDGRLQDRQVDTLIGISKGLVADGVVTQDEAEFLQNWLRVNQSVIVGNIMLQPIHDRVEEMMADGTLDAEESEELLKLLEDFTGQPSDEGELLRSTGIALDNPLPAIRFRNRKFAFTGKFAHGNRRDCRQAIIDRGGTFCRSVITKLDYLVIGHYVTPAWKYESYGTKILTAMDYRIRFGQPCIVPESHWAAALRP